MSKVKIIKESSTFIVAHKPAGMPVQPDQSKSESALDILSSLKDLKLHLCTRIDRPVSGLILLSTKSTGPLKVTQSKTLKKYIAIVEKGEIEQEGSIMGYLARDGQRKRAIFSSEEKEGYRKARLDYRILESTDRYHILDIELLTGKFHQIRCMLSHIGCPIKGDVKYGARRAEKDKSIYLHCYHIENKQLSIKASYAPPMDSTLWQMARRHV